eukprot:gene9802-10807_t
MRFNEDQFSFLASKARDYAVKRGYLYKKSGKRQNTESQGVRLQKRWYALHYNLMFYYEHETSSKAIGVILIERSVCRRYPDPKICGFIIGGESDEHRQFMFVATNEDECNEWIEAINESSGEGLRARNAEYKNKIEELESQVIREKQAKERLQRECADQWSQVARLKFEVSGLRDKSTINRMSNRLSDSSRDSTCSNLASPGTSGPSDEEFIEQYSKEDNKKIIKLQCSIRGWLVRKRFHRLVSMYITSKEGEQLMKRNREDYVQQLSTLVKIFHRPFSMAAESNYQACSVEEVKTIFANIDVILILHKMFLEGIKHRLKYWPDMHLDDYLSAMVSLIPVYHDYIRNHTSALQTLSQCKRRPKFMKLLSWYENKPECSSQTVEQFLHYPVSLLPTYARILRQLLEATPSGDPQKCRLQEILEKIEILHNSMNVELSESESIKQTLEIERLIVGGCDVLLDANQKFIRTGLLRHYVTSKVGFGIVREKTRHCFLFSQHLIITSRTSDGSFRLAKICGKIPLKYTTLVEDVDDKDVPQKSRDLAFTLQVQTKLVCFHVTLMAARATDKAIWTSDISQCIYSLTLEAPDEEDEDYENEREAIGAGEAQSNENSSTQLSRKTPLSFQTISIKDDLRLTTNADDIKYAERIGSNNLPQILYASLERLIERLVDPRLPGTDFTDTFLVTYRYFTTGRFVLQALINFYKQLEDDRNHANGVETFAEEKLDNNNILRSGSAVSERKTSLQAPIARDRSSSIMSTSSSMSSFDDYDSLSPLLPTDVVNFATLTRRQSRVQWYDNPLSDASAANQKPRSMSQENIAVSERPCDESLSRRKTSSPAAFVNNGYHSTLKRAETPLSDQSDLRSDCDENNDELRSLMSRTESEQSVNSICSDEAYDRQLETLIEATREEGQTSDGKHGNEARESEAGDVIVEEDSDESHVNVEIEEKNNERGIDVEEPVAPNGGLGISELHIDLRQRMLVRQHLNEHRPSLPAVLQPRIKQGKDLSKWLGITDSPNSLLHQNKKKNKKDKSKDKVQEMKTTRSPSSSSSNGSQNDDRRSLIFEDDEKTERTPSPTSSKKSLRSAISSPFPHGKSKHPPESPKKKFFTFSKTPKTSKLVGVKRAKSELIHQDMMTPTDDHDALMRKSRTLGNGSFIHDEDTRSLCALSTVEDVVIKVSASEGNLKEKALARSKREKHVTLKIDKVDEDDQDNKHRTNSYDFSRDPSRVSMRAILPNRAPLKILNIMKHWLSKHYQDFEKDSELVETLRIFFGEVKKNPDTLPVVKEIVKSMERLMETNRQSISNSVEDVFIREATNQVELPETFPSTWYPIKVADDLTILEHYLYGKISTREFMKCAWTKKDKEEQAPYITKISRRFNQVSGMVAHEVIHSGTENERAARIEFWIAVAARCRDLNNFNSVLQITSGLMKSSVYRLKKSWELVNKQLREVLNDLQSLVSADNCFGKLREAIHNCNPPCVPFIGFYLTDLLFMDERAPNRDETELINFAKMSKISRAIREIRQYQQLRYTMELDINIAQYLLASHVDSDIPDFEDMLYEQSLVAEPRG